MTTPNWLPCSGTPAEPGMRDGFVGMEPAGQHQFRGIEQHADPRRLDQLVDVVVLETERRRAVADALRVELAVGVERLHGVVGQDQERSAALDELPGRLREALVPGVVVDLAEEDDQDLGVLQIGRGHVLADERRVAVGFQERGDHAVHPRRDPAVAVLPLAVSGPQEVLHALVEKDDLLAPGFGLMPRQRGGDGQEHSQNHHHCRQAVVPPRPRRTDILVCLVYSPDFIYPYDFIDSIGRACPTCSRSSHRLIARHAPQHHACNRHLDEHRQERQLPGNELASPRLLGRTPRATKGLPEAGQLLGHFADRRPAPGGPAIGPLALGLVEVLGQGVRVPGVGGGRGFQKAA